MVQRVQDLYRKHERWVPIAFFILGFLFDTIMLQRIDELSTIIQQALYLVIAGGLISIELIETTREINPPKLLNKIWRYREALLHFLLGTLLNSYAIFYFKSASSLTSFVFIALLVILLILNEFKRFGKSQIKVHMAFLSLCLISYFVSLMPILLGYIGTLPFLGSILASALASYGFYRLQKYLLGSESNLLRTHFLIPFPVTQLTFVILYFAHAIPPVPLSVSYMGIFHGVSKQEGNYQLSYTRSKWKFWQNGDQSFQARPGDSIFCFVRVFSPARFNDMLQVRWLYWDQSKGWLPSDAIPMPVLGGREEGYRGVTKKNNYQAGEWRVQIETMENREIGRINFTVENDQSTEEREVKMIIH